MFATLIALAFIFLILGLLVLKFTYGVQRMSSQETSTGNLQHFIQSGSRKCHGMVRTKSGDIQADSKASNSFLGSFF